MLARKISIITLYLLLLSSTFTISQVHSQTPSASPTPDTSSKATDLQSKIKEFQGKITELQGQKKTLSSQLAVMDNQIKLSEFRISSSKDEIEQLTGDIEIATSKVTKLEGSLDKITQILLKRISASYMQSNVQPFEILLASNSMSDTLARSQYLKIVQRNDQKLLMQTVQAKSDYQNQKTIFEEKKKKVEALQKQLEAFTEQLDAQKQEKQNLLAATKNSESEYQKRLADAQKELQQIQKAAKSLVSTEPRTVKRGEVIGYMGNSGYSFGAHLQFGVYNITSLAQYDYYSNAESPANVLEGKNVNWDTGCGGDPIGQNSTGNGSFTWPMATDNLTITQGYGQTCYSNVYYRGKPHPGFDMYNNVDTEIRAADDGQAYFCRNCTGDGGNGVFIFHSNGKMTLYWHLQ